MDNEPKTLSLHLTDLCDSHCVFCVVDAPRQSSDAIVPDRIKQVLCENAGRGYGTVNVHGGEPTAHRGFLDILRLVKSLGYPRVHLQTNGRTLQDLAFVRTLRELNVELFIVSIHGACATTHDSLTQSPGALAAVRRAIVNIKQASGRVQTNTVVMKQNLAELPAIVDSMLDLGVDCINISCLHPVGTAYSNFDLIAPTMAETRKWVPRAVELAVARSTTVTLEGFPMCAVPLCESYHLGRRPGVISMEFRGSSIPDYDRFMDEQCRLKGPDCSGCSYHDRCSGVYKEYAMKRGWSEFIPIRDPSWAATGAEPVGLR